ncbi:MAG: protoporphyrinogen oxidase [Verrucomicrobia bacterium]|nr:protoporphyrinogen oxidase [Verrucomicrobiota bacterium]
MKQILIIGGGISGLSLAYFLRGKAEVTLLEAAPRLGGWIATDTMGDFLFERGPHTLRSQVGLDLARELNLPPCFPSKMAKQRFLWSQGKLRALPTNPLQMLFSPLLRGVKKALWKERTISPTSLTDESVASFFTRRFNALLAERLVDPLVSGIFAGDISTLSMKMAFPSLWEGEKQCGSLWGSRRQWKGKRHPTFSFPTGMETLIHKLAAASEATIHLNCPVTSISPHLTVSTPTRSFCADHIFSTLPWPKLAPLLGLEGGIHSLTNVVTLNLGYRKPVLPCRGFGYLIPRCEKQRLLGALWPSEVFLEQNQGPQTRLSVMLGGAHDPEIVHLSDEEILEIALQELSLHLGIETEPTVASCKRNCLAIPHFPVGYTPPVSPFSGLTLLGTSLGGISVDASLQLAKQVGSAFYTLIK